MLAPNGMARISVLMLAASGAADAKRRERTHQFSTEDFQDVSS